METLKSAIKLLADGQRNLRLQAKSVHFTGERTISPYQAFVLHEERRLKLRLLYATMGVLKGKTLKEIEPVNKGSKLELSYYQKAIDKLVLLYGQE